MRLVHPTVVVEGVFRSKTSHDEVGRFTRWLALDRDGAWTVKHCVIFVDEAWRRRRIAWQHYRGALAFYRRIGARRVDLDADDFGPYVWGAFMFEYKSSEWSMLNRALDVRFRDRYGKSITFHPKTASGLAVLTGPNGEALGESTIREVYAGMGGSLKMSLDLTDHATLERLYNAKLLERDGK